MVKIERVFHQKVSILPSFNLLHQMIGKLRQWAPQATRRPGFKLAIASPMARTSQLSTIARHESRSPSSWFSAGTIARFDFSVFDFKRSGFREEPVSRSRLLPLEEGDRVESADAQLTRASGGLTDDGATEFQARA